MNSSNNVSATHLSITERLEDFGDTLAERLEVMKVEELQGTLTRIKRLEAQVPLISFMRKLELEWFEKYATKLFRWEVSEYDICSFGVGNIGKDILLDDITGISCKKRLGWILKKLGKSEVYAKSIYNAEKELIHISLSFESHPGIIINYVAKLEEGDKCKIVYETQKASKYATLACDVE